jgi:hypothetical protein
MRFRIIVFILLICVLCAATFVWYRDHVCVKDREQVEKILFGDGRFSNIQVRRLGTGLILDGSVASAEDLDLLFERVNEIKRGRVVSKITVQTNRPLN